MLSWIPLLGPIFQGISSIFQGYFSTRQAEIQSETTDAQTAATIIHDTNDDIGLRIVRDFALVPPVVWSFLIGWDTIVAVRFPYLQFHVANYPPDVQYIPYGAFVFLFGLLGFKIWKGKL